jgi:hypothetical protein
LGRVDFHSVSLVEDRTGLCKRAGGQVLARYLSGHRGGPMLPCAALRRVECYSFVPLMQTQRNGHVWVEGIRSFNRHRDCSEGLSTNSTVGI